MEGRGREGGKLSSTNPAKPVSILTLRNFTIPRKKRVSGQVLLEPCPEESRDYSLIQSKLREVRLDMRKEHANDWLWNDVKLVHNEEFLKEFSEKRSEMRTKGRHGREMEERFCFLVTSHETTTQIYQHGLRTDTQDHFSLGKSSHGVYLFRHVDVALKHAATRTLSGKHLIVFKVLFGKVKKVTPSLDWKKTPDPMVAFDCHMSRDAVSYRESLSQQVLGSSVFLFDYNEHQELNKRPRQCLPYAVVFVPAINAMPPTSISPPVSPVKHPTSLTHGPLEHLRGCTVAKRRGKGENATVTFKHFATQGCPGPDYTSQIYGMDTTSVQNSELQSPPTFIPPQLYTPLFQTSGYFSSSLPYADNIPFPNTYPDESTFSSNAQLLDTTGIHGSNTDKCDVIPQSSAERISTIVYSSRLVKDPRLSRQEMNIKKNSLEQEKANNGLECDDLRCQPHLQNQEEKNDSTRTESCETQSLQMVEEQSKDCCLKPSQDDPQKHSSNLWLKAENMPSIKLFKMKFQKYAAYLRMSEEERHKIIWSQEGLTPDQKQLLIDRICFYEMYYLKYKQGVLFQKDTETGNALSSCHRKPKNNKTPLDKSPLGTQGSTVNNSHMAPLVSSNVSNLASTTDLVDDETAKVDTSSTDNNKFRQNGTKLSNQTRKTLKEKEQNPPTDSNEHLAGPQNESVDQSVGESGSAEFLEKGSLMLNNSEKREVSESIGDFEHYLCLSCPSEQGKVNPQPVREIKCSTIASDSTLSNNMGVNQELQFHDIIAMDVANCIDISVVEVTENNDFPSATAMGLDQNSLSCTKTKDRESLIHSKSGDNSKMSIEVKRGELRPDNTIYSALYKRLQLDQLLPKLNGTNTFSNKSYLCPKDLNKIPCISQLYNHLNKIMSKEECSKAEMQNWEYGEEDLQLIVKSRSQQVSVTTERLTLSERFSKLRRLQKKQKAIGNKKKVTNNKTVPPTGDLESDAEGLGLSNGEEKEMGSNVKLIQLLSQRFNAARELASCKNLSGKCSKVQSRKRTNSCSLSFKLSARPPTPVLRRILYFRKKYLWKEMKKWKTKLNPNRTSQCHILCSKSISNPSPCPPPNTGTPQSCDSNSCLNMIAASQSSGPQNYNKQRESRRINKCNQGELTNMSTNDQSCLNTSISENDPSPEDGFMHITESKQQPTDVCEFVLKTSSDDDSQEAQGDLPLDVKNPVMTEEMEPERGTKNNRICHQEKASPVTCSGNNESNSNGKIAKARQKEEVTAQRKLSQANTKEEKDKYDTGEVCTDNNVGVNEGKSKLVQAVSSIPNDITSGNMIISSTTKAQTAMTTDLPRLMNNDVTDREIETRTLHNRYVDKAGNSVSKLVVDIMANESSAERAEDIQNSNLGNIANITDVNDKMFIRAETSLVDQNQTLQSAKDDFISSHKNINHHSEPTSSSQCQPSEISSVMINSHVETTADLQNKVIKDAKGPGIVVMPDNRQSAWHRQDKNNTPCTSTETQLISKLRDYLTKFEFTVKRQESVNDSVKDGQVPMAWITLDSTVHKQQLLDTRHYNTLHLAKLRNQGRDFVSNQKDHNLNYMLPSMTNEEITGKANVKNSSVAPIKRKTTKDHNQSKGYASKRKRRSNLVRVSPDSTCMLETVQKDSHTHLIVNMDTDQLQSVPNMQQWIQKHGNTVQQSQTESFQGSENLNGSSIYQPAEKATEVNERTLYDKKVTNTYVQNKYSVTNISSILKLADHAVSVAELYTLQLKCQQMLHHFISNFERDQNISFHQSCISRNLILERYLDRPPVPVELKFGGLNSFLELQMMVEAFQFIENKINFLSRKATFRSLLWYDPSLYGELYKGAVGFQQQSSLFSSFQQCIISDGYSKLQEYYTAVSTLHQQLQDAPDTSYYMYLKSKRERLEIEAALRNHPDIKSFFLSVPVALMMNFGDSLESLEKAHHKVMTFVETPSDRLPGTFDVGKAEHLSIICRYLQEKLNFTKSTEQISKVSWFGLEHLLYDASKLLVWRESEHGMSNEVLLKYKRSNPQIVYGVTESGVALVNKMEQPAHPVEILQITLQQQMDGVRNTQSEVSAEKVHNALDIQTKDRMKEIHQPVRRRATHPPLTSNLNEGGVTPLIQPNLPAQLVRPTPYTDFSQRNSAVEWRMTGNHAWDWNPPSVVQPSKSHPEIRALLLSKRRATIPFLEPRADIQNNNNAVRKQQWPPPLFMDSRVVERNNQKPIISPPHHTELRKEQTNEPNALMMPPFPFTGVSPEMNLGVPSSVSLLPFSNTSNQVTSHEISTPLNYPYFVFNGQTYSNLAPSVSVPASALHAETRYHPHPV